MSIWKLKMFCLRFNLILLTSIAFLKKTTHTSLNKILDSSFLSNYIILFGFFFVLCMKENKLKLIYCWGLIKSSVLCRSELIELKLVSLTRFLCVLRLIHSHFDKREWIKLDQKNVWVWIKIRTQTHSIIFTISWKIFSPF